MKTPFDNIIDNIGKQIDQLIDRSANENDMKRSAKVIIQSAFERLDLVSRDEFDAQAAVLATTRRRLEQLEAELHQKT